MRVHRLATSLAVVLVAVAVLNVGTVSAKHFPPASSLHLEAIGLTSDAFDFEARSYVDQGDIGADFRLGHYPGEVVHHLVGYRLLVGLNGAVLANLGVVDYASVGCAEFDAAGFAGSIASAYVDIVPLAGTVHLVKTGAGTLVKMNLTLIDFTTPNGLGWEYEIVDCSGPGTGADTLIESGVPGNGLAGAPGLQKGFNPNSKAGENAGKK